MNVDVNNFVVKYFLKKIHKYDKYSYWSIRDKVVNKNNKCNRLYKLFLLYKIKKVDAFNNASLGTDLNNGAVFKGIPIFPHGLNGIIIGHDVVIGQNVTIFQQVTIMQGNVIIGNNVIIGAGAKILPNVRIGRNAKIGANCVVINDVPENATCVLNKPRIILSKDV